MSALARAEEGARDLAAGGAQDGPEDVFDLASATLGGSLAGGFLLLLLLFDLSAQAFHFLFSGGLFLGGGLLRFLGGLLGSLFGFLGRLFRCLLSLLAGLFFFLDGGLLGGRFLAGGLGLGGAALKLFLGR